MVAFVIVTGGTGGHLYPALSCAEELKARCPDATIVVLGSKLASIAHKNRFPSIEIEAMPLVGHFGKKMIALARNAKGVVSSWKALREIQPLLVVAFGSYATVPTLAAARLLHIPFVLHEANSFPGRATRLFAPYAEVTALHFPQAAQHLVRGGQLVRMPLREGLVTNLPSRAEALQRYGLSMQKQTCLVMGGSQGSRAINRAVAESARALSTQFGEQLQLLHLVGPEADIEALRTHYRHSHLEAVVRHYEEEMKFAWTAADFALCRGGASTIAEARFFSMPLVVIPYPYAADGHQERNARALIEEGYPATLLLEQELSSDQLVAALKKAIDACARNSTLGMNGEIVRNYFSSGPSLVDLILSLPCSRNSSERI